MWNRTHAILCYSKFYVTLEAAAGRAKQLNQVCCLSFKEVACSETERTWKFLLLLRIGQEINRKDKLYRELRQLFAKYSYKLIVQKVQKRTRCHRLSQRHHIQKKLSPQGWGSTHLSRWTCGWRTFQVDKVAWAGAWKPTLFGLQWISQVVWRGRRWF